MLTITYNKHITKKKLFISLLEVLVALLRAQVQELLYINIITNMLKNNFFANFECNIPELIKFSIPW